MTRLPKALALHAFKSGWRSSDTAADAFAKACKAAGQRNLVGELLDPFRIIDPEKAPPGVPAALQAFKPRPWYSAAELARLWPLVCIGLAGKENGISPTPAKLAKMLTAAGLPKVKQWDGSTEFLHNGKRQEFFIVTDVWRLASMRFTQTDFDRVMSK